MVAGSAGEKINTTTVTVVAPTTFQDVKAEAGRPGLHSVTTTAG